MEKEIKLMLLEKLMDEMDDGISSRLKKEVPVAEEEEELPEVAVVGPADEEEELDEELPVGEPPAAMEDEEEDLGNSRLLEKLRALKKNK